MKKRFVIIPAAIAIICCIFVAFALVAVLNMNKYSLDSENFEMTIEYNGEIDVSDLTIYNKLFNREVMVEDFMIVSCDDTSTVGEKVLVIKYKKQEFTIHFNVKYKIEFMVDDEVINTQYVTTAEEIVLPENVEKSGYEFISWDKTIPTSLQDNMAFNAVFSSTTLEIPALKPLTAEYGTKLSQLQLPGNIHGRWVFVDNIETFVGNVGENKFAVKFIPNTTELVEKYDEICIDVTPKYLEFVILKDTFTYDGNPHFPTYSLPADVDIQIIGEPQTEVGETYQYALVVNDSNYSGYYLGVFAINKADVKITVEDKTVDYAQKFEMNYSVDGFENEELLGITINMPAILNAGEYEVGASIDNSNINLTVNKGKLVINKIDMNPAPVNPTLSTAKTAAVYGDLLSSITFVNDFANGSWAWENSKTVIDKVTEFSAFAIFTPKSSNYNLIRRELEIQNINKKELTINITENIFTYDANQHKISYQIEDGRYADIDVVGNTAEINAGKYYKTLSINNEFYQGYVTAELIINKATPVTDFSHKYSKTWHSGIKLENISLNSGYSWVNSTTSLDNIGTFTYPAQFTPSDTNNYNSVTGSFEVTINKAEARINNVKDSYNYVYTGNALKLAEISPSHYETNLQYTYFYDGSQVSSIIDAGQYQVIIALAESAHYFAAEASTTVNVEKASVEVMLQTLTATYEDTLQDVILPKVSDGTWSWKEDVATLVGNAGEQHHTAIYTPNNNNYASVEIEATINVAKKDLEFNIINNIFVYTGDEYCVEYTITDKNGKAYEGLTISGNDAYVNAEIYNVTLIVVDNNYEATKSTQLIINKAKLTPTTPTGLTATYLDTLNSVQLPTSDSGVWNWNVQDNTLVGKSGQNKFSATFVYNEQPDCDNYEDYTTELTVTVCKKIIQAPRLETDSQVYTGSEIKANIEDGDDYIVTVNGWINVGDYNVELTLRDCDYIWSSGEESVVKLPFAITKAKAIISDLDLSNWTYDENPKQPSAKTNFGEVVYTYGSSMEGEFTSTVPTNAGTHYVKASVEGTDNYEGTSAIKAFEIYKAKNAIKNLAISGWTYGEGAKAPSATSNYGKIVYKYSLISPISYSETVPKNAGNYYLKAEVLEGDNYLGTSDTVEFKISKKIVTSPQILSKKYTGDNIKSGLKDTDIYVVYEDLGGTEKGTYNVVLKLKDFNNYRWLESDNETITLSYTITSAVNEWTSQQPELVTWTYGEDPKIPTVTARFGTVKVSYKHQGSADEYSSNVVTDAGNYIIRFMVEGESYNSLEMLVPLIITKAEITQVPKIDSKDYTGSTLKADISTSEQYTVTENEGGIVVGDYVVKLTATSNYKWATGNELVAEFTFKITKASNQITSLALEGWGYGEDPNTPVATAEFGVLSVQYSYSTSETGTFVSTAPSDAGTYYLKATIAPTDNYYGASKTISFDISIADNEITSLTLEGWKYNDAANTPSATAKFGTSDIQYSYSTSETGTFVSTQPSNAGTYYVKAEVGETVNYKGASDVVSFIIEKDDIEVPVIASKPYNKNAQCATIDKLDQFEVTTNESGTDVKPEGYSVVLTITDSNYKWATGDETVAELKFYITQAENSISLSRGDWVYKQAASTLSVSANFGAPTITYYDAQNKTYKAEELIDVGTYYVKAEVAETSNYEGATATASFKITQAPNQIKSLSLTKWTYNQTANLPSATADFGTPTFTYSDKQDGTFSSTVPTNAGTYYVKAEVAENVNYAGASKVISFTIDKAYTEITDLKLSNWEYSQAAKTPVIKTNDFVLSNDIEYYYRPSSAAVESATKSIPTAVGEYWVYAKVKTSNNYIGCVSSDIGFTISKMTPKVTNPTYDTIYMNKTSNGYIYSAVGMDTFKSDIVECYKTAPIAKNHANTAVDGTWTASNIKHVHGTNTSSMTLSFTPSDAQSYTSITNIKINMTIKSVAHIGSTYYPTIEDALIGATNTTVFVDADITGKVRINKDCIIPSGVTLVLPYGANETDRTSDGKATLNHSIAAECDALDKLALKNLVIINNGVKLTNYGTLEIAGELSSGGGGTPFAGHTARNYAELRLNAEAQIISEGLIKLTGFINEASSKDGGNNSKVIVKKGELHIPFVLRDFRGGTYMALAYANGICPFSQYQLRNITSRTIIEHNGKIQTFANVYIDGGTQTPQIGLLGKGEECMFKFTDSTYSYAEFKYNSSTQVCDLDVYGGMQVNPIKFKITIKSSDYEMDTSSLYFPINWSFDISLNQASGQSSNAIYISTQQLKLMPGAILTIGKGVEATLTNISIYSSYTDTTEISNETKYPSKDAAKLIVNGTMTCDNLGGNVCSTLKEGSAIVTVKSEVSITTKETKGKTYVIYIGTKSITNAASFSFGTTKQIAKASKGTYTFTATKQEADGTITTVNKWAKTA